MIFQCFVGTSRPVSIIRCFSIRFHRARFLLLLLPLALIVACGAPQTNRLKTASGSLLDIKDRIVNLAHLSDAQILTHYDTAEEKDLFSGEKGMKKKQALNDRLTERFRRRFPHIHPMLWAHILPEDWTVVLRNSGRLSELPEKARIPTHPIFPENHAGGKLPQTGALQKVRPKIEGTAVRVPGGTTMVLGETIQFPPVRYEPPPPDQTAEKRAEEVLGRISGKPVRLGKRIGGGAMRYVFFHPADPSLVIKTYDPSLLTKMKTSGAVRQSVEVMTAFFIQRELTLQRFLTKVQSAYQAKGLDPPFLLAPVQTDDILIQNGIILQPKVKGMRPWKDLPGRLTLERLENLDYFFAFHRQLNKPLYNIFSKRYGIRIAVKITGTAEPENMGIDLGGTFSNMFIDDHGVPILIDW